MQMQFLLKVKWDNEVTEIVRSSLAAADFKEQIPGVKEAAEIAHVYGPAYGPV
jgi:hypothetical protein